MRRSEETYLMNTFRIVLNSNRHYTTGFNGSLSAARAYFLGQNRATEDDLSGIETIETVEQVIEVIAPGQQKFIIRDRQQNNVSVESFSSAAEASNFVSVANNKAGTFRFAMHLEHSYA
jgi:hypothetical protein